MTNGDPSLIYSKMVLLLVRPDWRRKWRGPRDFGVTVTRFRSDRSTLVKWPL